MENLADAEISPIDHLPLSSLRGRGGKRGEGERGRGRQRQEEGGRGWCGYPAIRRSFSRLCAGAKNFIAKKQENEMYMAESQWTTARNENKLHGRLSTPSETSASPAPILFRYHRHPPAALPFLPLDTLLNIFSTLLKAPGLDSPTKLVSRTHLRPAEPHLPTSVSAARPRSSCVERVAAQAELEVSGSN